MSEAKSALPQQNGDIFITDGGVETYMMYKRGFELPNFSLFHLLNNDNATRDLREYYCKTIEVALKYKVGMILCSLHYRASRDWGDLLGYSPEGLADINRKGIDLFLDLKREYETDSSPILISGNVGPRGDAYKLNKTMSVEEAENYHTEQIATLKDAGADLITALTLNEANEAIGITRAASKNGIPVVIAFTLDANGKLKTGQTLKKGIELVDQATDNAPTYYLINCSHPDDFEPALEEGDWVKRLGGFRPNASPLDKGILCQLGHLEEGDPEELGQQMGELARRFPHMSVWGGCCGTDYTHTEHICRNVIGVRTGLAD